MMDLSKRSGIQLFTLFMLIGAVIFVGTSFFIVKNQAKDTARLFNEENLEAKFTAVEKYLSEFLHSNAGIAKKIAEHPATIASVLEGIDNKAAYHDQIHFLRQHDTHIKTNIYNFLGDVIYSEGRFPSNVKEKISGWADDSSLSEKPSYSFFKDGNVDYLIITQPILYNGHAEGLAAYTINLTERNFLEELNQSNNHWFGIAQNRFGWEMDAPSGWQVKSTTLQDFSIVLSYAFSPYLLENTQNELLSRLFFGVLIAASITLSLLYLLGRKLLVSPYQRLFESEKQLERYAKSLKEKEKEATLLARVAKNMRDAVVFTDKNEEITWVNDSFLNMTGYAEGEVIGKRPGVILQGPKTDGQTKATIRQHIDALQYGQFEILNYDKAGNEYWLEVAITPLFDLFGELEGFMAVERDITERKNLQDSLSKKAIEAEAANVAKSQFLASMSHELRTPMNGILGVGGLLHECDLDTEQSEFVDILISSGNHMLAVLNDILDFSKIESGKLELENIQFSLSEVADKLTRMYEPLCRDKGLQFHSDLDVSSADYCLGDVTRITQILQNLLNNAVKFTETGSVSISMRAIEENGERIVISVKDTGIGISPEKHELVFDPFSQAERDTTRTYGGTGLGLAITSELVKAMKGEIQIESDLGKGSAFTINIPTVFTLQRPAIIQENQPVFNGNGANALLVEDNDVNVFVISKLLKSRGFVCEVAANGEVGVEKAKSGHFELIIMDNHMPVMDGSTATEHIVSMNLDPQPIIIGCTADAFKETKELMMRVGCADVITKPINAQKLDHVLTTVYAKRYEHACPVSEDNKSSET